MSFLLYKETDLGTGEENYTADLGTFSVTFQVVDKRYTKEIAFKGILETREGVVEKALASIKESMATEELEIVRKDFHPLLMVKLYDCRFTVAEIREGKLYVEGTAFQMNLGVLA